MKNLSEFTNQYPVSKTLRMKLVPEGRTLETIQECGILEEDQHRSESYVLVKKIIDDYHKAYIESALTNFALKSASDDHNDSLEELYQYYNRDKKDEKEKATYEKIQGNLRKQIVRQLTQSEAYKRIGKKELIQEDLLNFVWDDPDRDSKTRLIKEFKDFTTYFTGFHENRQNMYSDEAQTTAIAYRLIHENLPKFIDNIHTFAQLMQTPIADELSKLYADFKERLKVNSIAALFQLDYFNTVLTQKQIDLYNAVVGGYCAG